MRSSNSGERRVRRISRLAIFTNSVQIICAVAILLFAIFSESFNLPDQAEIMLVAVASGVLIWGAVVDIRDALIMRRVEEQNRMLEEAYGQLENLNTTLRKQRHDFKNHLQVVYTLTEMQSHQDAQEYIRHIYEDIQTVGSLIRTSVPAVNALLAAKQADCAERGIRFEVEIHSGWNEIPVSGWEMCRIIGNLVDNAIDALVEGGTEDPAITVCIGETIQHWTLSVENNGPEIANEHRKHILLPGFTTKSAGHGNGLSIVSDLLGEYGGTLEFESTHESTRFHCAIPRLSLNV